MSSGWHIYKKEKKPIVKILFWKVRPIELEDRHVTSNAAKLGSYCGFWPEFEREYQIGEIRERLMEAIQGLQRLQPGEVLSWPQENGAQLDQYDYVTSYRGYVLNLFKWVLSFSDECFLIRENT